MEIRKHDDAGGRPITIRPPGDISSEDIRQRAKFLKCKQSVLYRFSIKLLMKWGEFFWGAVLGLSERWNLPPWEVIENWVICGIAVMDYNAKMQRHGIVPFILEDSGLLKGKALYDWVQEELAIRDESAQVRRERAGKPLNDTKPKGVRDDRPPVWEEE